MSIPKLKLWTVFQTWNSQIHKVAKPYDANEYKLEKSTNCTIQGARGVKLEESTNPTILGAMHVGTQLWSNYLKQSNLLNLPKRICLFHILDCTSDAKFSKWISNFNPPKNSTTRPLSSNKCKSFYQETNLEQKTETCVSSFKKHPWRQEHRGLFP